MALLRLLIGVARLAPYIADGYRKWQAVRAKNKKQQQVKQINDNPKETFTDEFGAAAGRVQLTDTKSNKLPSDTNKP